MRNNRIAKEDFAPLSYRIRIDDVSSEREASKTVELSEEEYYSTIRRNSDLSDLSDLARKLGFTYPDMARKTVTKLGVEKRESLFISADKSMFNLQGLESSNLFGFFSSKNRVEYIVADPIVFRHVRGGVLIITKWGLEADDEMLQIQ
jgi:hypothetical protein